MFHFSEYVKARYLANHTTIITNYYNQHTKAEISEFDRFSVATDTLIVLILFVVADLAYAPKIISFFLVAITQMKFNEYRVNNLN